VPVDGLTKDKMRTPWRTTSKKSPKAVDPFIEQLKADGVPDSFFLTTSQIKLGEKLGSGAFGTIHASTVSGWETSAVVAKVIRPQKLKPAHATLLRNEVVIWHQMDHQNIVRFLNMSADPLEVRLVCERCTGGTLEDALERAISRREPRLTLNKVTGQMLQIARALEHVHGLGFMHRDLKPANVLIEGLTFKLSDFGLARLKPEKKSILTAETGSYRWMAPEVMRHEPYDEKCDMYSFGLLCWTLLTRSLPFPSLSPIDAAFAVADEAKRPTIPADCAVDLAALIKRCWAPTSEDRPAFGEVVSPLAAMAATVQAVATRTTLPVKLSPPMSGPFVISDASTPDQLQPALKLTRSPPAALRRELSSLLGEEMEVLTLTPTAHVGSRSLSGSSHSGRCHSPAHLTLGSPVPIS
jgi:serine/threonine protein kinase